MRALLHEDLPHGLPSNRAGRDAAWRAMKNALAIIKPGKQARFMFLPDGEDPDTLIRAQAKTGFEAEMAKAMSFSEFFFDNLMQQVNMNSHDGRYQLKELSKPYLEKIEDNSFLRLMSSRLVELMELSEIDTAGVYSELGINSTSSPRRASFHSAPLQQRQVPSAVKKAISYLLEYPKMAETAGDPERFKSLELDGIDLFVQLLDILQNDPHLTTARLLFYWPEEAQEYQYLNQLAKETPVITDEQAIACEFNHILQLFARQYQQQRLSQLQRQERNQGLSKAQKNEYAQLLRSIKPA